MESRHFRKSTLATFAATTGAFILIVSGCSILPFSSSENSDKEIGFQKTVAPVGNLIPRPVEIAEDIEAILNPPPKESQVTAPSNDGSTASQNRSEERQPADEASRAVADEEPVKEEPLVTEAAEETAKAAAEETPGKKKSGSKGGKRVLYKVRSGDTLMKIAFEKYGNLYRWRQIFEDNRDRLTSWNKISVGMTLVLNGVEYVVIERNGQPYLIRKGDTLVKISNKVYGSPQHWRAIWKNNPQLIQNPNKIYAGFTLYYESLDKAEVRTPSSTLKRQRKNPLRSNQSK